jgi:hypothetical protein
VTEATSGIASATAVQMSPICKPTNMTVAEPGQETLLSLHTKHRRDLRIVNSPSVEREHVSEISF